MSSTRTGRLRLWGLGGLLVFLGLQAATPAAATDGRIDFLLEKLRDTQSFKVRLKAATLLGRTLDAKAVSPLCQALRDENYVVRAAAAKALGNLGHPLAVDGVDPLLNAVNDEESFVRKEIRQALEKLAGEKSLPRFMAAARHENSAIRLVAVHVLSLIDATQAREVVLGALADSEEEVRAESIISIRSMEPAESEKLMVAALARRLPFQVHQSMLDLMVELRSATAISDLTELLEKKDLLPELRVKIEGVIQVLRATLDPAELTAQARSGNFQSRENAIRKLGALATPLAVDVLLGLLPAADLTTRQQVIQALGITHDARTLPALQRLLQSEPDLKTRQLLQTIVQKLRKPKV